MRPKSLSADRRVWSVLAFGGFLLLGFIITPHYGLYIDEFTNHVFGLTWYNYVHDILVHHAPIAPLATATEADVIHGPVFEMTLAWIEKIALPHADLREIVVFRHYATWGLFYLSVVGVYILAHRLWSSRPLALLASLFLVMQPRIFAHAFYDSMDIAFLAFYTGSIFTLVRYLDRRTFRSLGLHALVCALAIDIRSLGGLIPAITMALLLAELLPRQPATPRLIPQLGRMIFFVAAVSIITVLLWPFLWDNPPARIMDVIRQTPRIDWQGIVLYAGHQVIAPELPWHYIPVWILISTPFVILGFFFVGLGELAIATLRNPLATLQTRAPELAIAAAAILPVAAVILLHAVVYDSWRHLFFIAPAIALIALAGVRHVLSWIDQRLTNRRAVAAKATVTGLIALNLATVGWFMIKNHPYQNLYFNRLAGRDLTAIKPRFEMDFWGLSYVHALEYVMAQNPDRPIKIFGSTTGLLAINRLALTAEDQARIEEVDFDDAEFVLTTFREKREGYSPLDVYYTVDVEGEPILCVYRKQPKLAD